MRAAHTEEEKDGERGLADGQGSEWMQASQGSTEAAAYYLLVYFSFSVHFAFAHNFTLVHNVHSSLRATKELLRYAETNADYSITYMPLSCHSAVELAIHTALICILLLLLLCCRYIRHLGRRTMNVNSRDLFSCSFFTNPREYIRPHGIETTSVYSCSIVVIYI